MEQEREQSRLIWWPVWAVVSLLLWWGVIYAAGLTFEYFRG